TLRSEERLWCGRCGAVVCVCEIVVFFFFQAEDGIRDWSVTGVQTCALPISVLDERALAIEREEIERLAKDRDDEQAILDRNVYEIGRASCRERGEISVVEGSLKKKKGGRGGGVGRV